MLAQMLTYRRQIHLASPFYALLSFLIPVKWKQEHIRQYRKHSLKFLNIWWEAPFSFQEILTLLVCGLSHAEELRSSPALRSALYHPVRKWLLQHLSANRKGQNGLSCLLCRMTFPSEGVRAQFVNVSLFTSSLTQKKITTCWLPGS